MIKPFRTFFTCIRCGFRQSREIPTDAWIRSHEALRFISVTDSDKIFWKYNSDRSVFWMMDVEIKEFGATQYETQSEIWRMRDALLRGKHSLGARTIFHVGCHVLRSSGAGPAESEWIEWDGVRIDVQRLLAILAFKASPDF
jgi:hypothetical protein